MAAYEARLQGESGSLIPAIGLDLLGWLFFFRDFLLLGLPQVLDPSDVALQAVACALVHLGKAKPEAVRAVFGGTPLGWLAWATGLRSVPHPLVHVRPGGGGRSWLEAHSSKSIVCGLCSAVCHTADDGRWTMSLKTLELTLTGHAYGGDAFGRDPDGRMVFVPFALPEERVRLELVEIHQRWVRARLIEILQPSPDRVEPRCPHFADCGGCHYQHLAYPAQLQAKAEIVRAQLERLGGLTDLPLEPTFPSPSPWNTRNHLQFSLTEEGRLGFLAAGSHRVVPIQVCHLPEPPLADLWPRLSLEAIPGLDRVSLRCGAEGEAMVILEGLGRPEVELMLEVPASVVWSSGESSAVLAGSGDLMIEVLGRRFRVSAESFFQVHTALAGELVRRVLEALAIQPGQVVFDLYAGVGLFSAFLAQAGARLVAVEVSPSASADFEVNLDEFEGVELYEAPVEQALPAIGLRPQAVVLDPPRAGLPPEVIGQLAALAPARLAYVSCDPATLARDARRLMQVGYRLERLTPLDLFPQTYHIETLSTWHRSDA